MPVVPLKSFFALLFVPLCWGASFPLLRMLVLGLSPAVALCLRFGLAALAFAPFAGSRAQCRSALPWGMAQGGLYAIIYALVGHALQHSSSPRVGFLMGLSVVWVPLLEAAWRRRWPRPLDLTRAGISLVGLALFSQFRFSSLQPGEGGVLLAAPLFALSTLLMHAATGRGGQHPASLLLAQCATTSLCILPVVLWQASNASSWAAWAQSIVATPAPVWWALVYGALVPTVACQQLIARHQHRVGPAIAASIYLLQSVFNLLTATLLFGERLTPPAVVGGLIIFTASWLPALYGAAPAGQKTEFHVNSPSPANPEAKAAAVILLSGGLDSATVLHMAKAQGKRLYALSFFYGQRQHIELTAAKKLARDAGCCDHKVAEIDLRIFGGSALTADIDVPKETAETMPYSSTQASQNISSITSAASGIDGGKEREKNDNIPITYVPARNTIFLAYALAYAEVIGAQEIHLGINAVDYSGYPDCRPEYLTAYEKLANLATRAGVNGTSPMRLVAPLLHLSKAQIIIQGTALGVPYAETHSCYDPQKALACGRCAACTLRRQGFADAKVPDPTNYIK